MFFSPGNGNPSGFENMESTKFTPGQNDSESKPANEPSLKDTSFLEIRALELRKQLEASQDEVEVLRVEMTELKAQIKTKIESEAAAQKRMTEQQNTLDEMETDLKSKCEEVDIISVENEELNYKLEALQLELSICLKDEAN